MVIKTLKTILWQLYLPMFIKKKFLQLYQMFLKYKLLREMHETIALKGLELSTKCLGHHVVKSGIIYMCFNSDLINSIQQCNRKKTHTICLFQTKNGGRASVCTQIILNFLLPFSPFSFICECQKQLNIYGSLTHTILWLPSSSTLFMGLPSLKIKLQVLSKPRMSASVKIYENDLIGNIFILN